MNSSKPFWKRSKRHQPSEKLNAATDADAVVAIAIEAGFGISAEDIQLMQSATEVSDEELQGSWRRLLGVHDEQLVTDSQTWLFVQLILMLLLR